jgi:transglutaminase-like putative cysteine protease
VRHFFSDLPANIAFRDMALFQSQPDKMAGYRKAYEIMQPYMAAAASAEPWQPYAAPTQYSFTQTLAVPRSALPATGELRIWLPLPAAGGPQTDVRISGVTPSPWLTTPPTIDGAISLMYLHVPLAKLTGDLDFSFRVSFMHAAQYFKVDPAHVGRYDKGSDLYRTYTASRGNTRITPRIRAEARRVVGGETNPYLAARRLYHYVIGTVKYSFMPHFALWPRGIPESVYVDQHRYGDCGAQSMYFAALCRSVGIPARTTGGFQLFGGTPAGHFWAEFYLPRYGWLPVDPTAAEPVDYLPEVSTQDKQAYRDFFFGGQDDLRLTVQKDVDLPLTPATWGRPALPVAIQMPAGVCDTMLEQPASVLSEYWTFK